MEGYLKVIIVQNLNNSKIVCFIELVKKLILLLSDLNKNQSFTIFYIMSRSSYKSDEFMKYQVVNNMLPKSLVQYCNSENNNYISIMTFEQHIDEIINSITKGDNPNAMIFKNFVKHYINMLSQSNYSEYLQKLKSLNFATEENIHFLASELIVCAMRCPISVKGFTFEEDPKYKSVPELCADVAKQFSQFIIKSGDKDISFHHELNNICFNYFTDFIDMNKSLDENNENTADNYKGFMTFLGLLYSRSIVNIKAIVHCLDVVKRVIFCSECMDPKHNTEHSCKKHHTKLLGVGKQVNKNLDKVICYYDCDHCHPTELRTYRKHIECINLYKGYEHLLNHVIHTLEIHTHSHIKNYEERTERRDKLEEFQESVLFLHKLRNNKTSVSDKDINKEIIDYIATKLSSEFRISNFDDYVSICKDEDEAYEKLTNLLDKDLEEITTQLVQTQSAIEKTSEYLEAIIKNHQEIIDNSQKYKSLNKNQLIPPFKPYNIIIHNTMGLNLNKLKDKLKAYCDKYPTLYKPIANSGFGKAK